MNSVDWRSYNVFYFPFKYALHISIFYKKKQMRIENGGGRKKSTDELLSRSHH